MVAERGAWISALPKINKKHFQKTACDLQAVFFCPTFAKGSTGAELHSSVAGILADKPLVQKAHADSFLNTYLLDILKQHCIEQIDICEIMPQNCVTHTALSPFAKGYKVRVLSNLCTAPTELIHQIALGRWRIERGLRWLKFDETPLANCKRCFLLKILQNIFQAA